MSEAASKFDLSSELASAVKSANLEFVNEDARHQLTLLWASELSGLDPSIGRDVVGARVASPRYSHFVKPVARAEAGTLADPPANDARARQEAIATSLKQRYGMETV
jgi:hypothetical protein